MQIEILDSIEMELYTLHVKNVKVWDDDKKTFRLYLDSDAFISIDDYLEAPQEYSEIHDKVYGLHQSPELYELLIWGGCIACYDINNPKDPYRNLERDRIWKILIEAGLVVLKEKTDE